MAGAGMCLAGALGCLVTIAVGDAAAEELAGLHRVMLWGHPVGALLPQISGKAAVLSPPIDFGDSYSNLVLRGVTVGGVPMIGFFQMDKIIGGLKRIQLERQRHGVNPPALRAVLGALEADYGVPDAICSAWPSSRSGYQATAERVWQREGFVIRVIFRDTTIEAYEGCLAGDPGVGSCGLTGQLLARISPPAVDAGACPAPPHGH